MDRFVKQARKPIVRVGNANRAVESVTPLPRPNRVSPSHEVIELVQNLPLAAFLWDVAAKYLVASSDIAKMRFPPLLDVPFGLIDNANDQAMISDYVARGHVIYKHCVTLVGEPKSFADLSLQHHIWENSHFALVILENMDVRIVQMPTENTIELTPRETEVGHFLVRGYNTGRIASEMGLTVQTVRNYLSVIYGKFGVEGRIQAILALQKWFNFK